MSEGEQPNIYHPEPQSNVGKWILIALAVAYVGASAFFIYDAHSKVGKITQDQAASQKQIGDLTKRMQSAEADSETLGHYEFTLLKGAQPQAFSTVALQLKKTDPKRGKYTLNVTADDRTIEKKDRNQSEPVQFYTGREHMLYELVAWTVDKNKITGYLSTPKNAPVPITASPQ